MIECIRVCYVIAVIDQIGCGRLITQKNKKLTGACNPSHNDVVAMRAHAQPSSADQFR